MDIYHVLLVDDEPAVLDALRLLLEEKTNVPLEIFRAYSSMGAMQVMQDHRIDIMFCDIRMPGLSGLQLAEMVRSQWPLCRIIILTAYMDFEFSRKALRLGVDDYILKADKDERMLEGFLNCVRRFDQEMAQVHRTASGDTNAAHKLSILRQNALHNAIWGQNDLAAQHKLLETLDYAAEKGRFYVILGTFEKNIDAQTELLMQEAERFFHSGDMTFRCVPFQEGVIWLAQSVGGTGHAYVDHRISGIFELIAQHMQAVNGSIGHFIISRPIDQTEELAKEVYFLQSRIHCLNDYSQIMIWQMQSRDYKLDDNHNRTIERVEQFINEHICEDLSLSSISSAIGYNASYLSRLYLTVTGQNIRDYVVEQKLSYIKSLMRQETLSLGAISKMTGFESQSYFNRFIRRFAHTTPGELRALALKDELS